MNIGDKIPEILGIDQDGNQIKASDYRGRKIVLYSYPKANTSGCTAEACSLQAHKAELEALGYSIIGISKDKQASQKKFASEQGLDYVQKHMPGATTTVWCAAVDEELTSRSYIVPGIGDAGDLAYGEKK
mgnify:CR=1 FL=1